MQILYPDYYHSFRCLASSCPDSCCKEWAVQVDAESARRYRSLPGELGDALRQALTEADGETILALTPDHRCPMWQDNGLCRIHAEMGEDWLCNTCSQFPRLRHDYGTFVELGLELSCPEAARLILSDTQGKMHIRSEAGAEEADYDEEVMSILLRTRKTALNFLTDCTYPVNQALAILLLYAHGVQNELDGGEEAAFSPTVLLAKATSLPLDGSVEALLDFYRNLEILTPAWKTRLSAPAPAPWAKELRAMARYFVQRYWLQAVSDFDLISRVKLTVSSCLLVRTLGRNLLETAQLYSKEIENDPDNLEAILDSAYTNPALTDLALLFLLLDESSL